MLTVDLAGVERRAVWRGSGGELERCASECQSVAQTDRRKQTVDPACFARRVWQRIAGNGMVTVAKVSSVVVSKRRPGSAGALLKRGSVRGADRPEKANCQPGMFCTTRVAEERWQRHVYRQGAELWSAVARCFGHKGKRAGAQ